MSLRRARSIDALSEAVGDSDIVLSTEAPLTLALDRRVTRPRIGRVAATPRSHAAGELVPDDTRDLFLTLVTETDLTWKAASRALELCLDCWNRTGALETITDYDEFDTPAIRTAVEVLSNTESSYRTLAHTKIPETESVTVIDEPAFTPLDRQVLPATYETVSPFAADEMPMPSVHIYPTATTIVETLVDQLDAGAADRVGVVLDKDSIYSPLLEAALETAGIPFSGGPGFLADDDVRTFLRLLQAAFTGSGLTVAQLRPLLNAAGFDVSRELDPQRVEHIDPSDPALSAAEQFFATVGTGTFAAALDEYEATAGVRVETLRSEIAELGILEEAITEARVNELVYYLQSFEVPIEQETDGVLLTDAASTAYVDRPVVFYLGLGNGWARTPPDLPWVDAATFTEQDRRRFELLLQNGQQRYYLVQDSRAGEEVLPCVYFRDFGDVEAFEGFEHVRYRTETVSEPTAGFDAPTPPSAVDPITSVSQSTLKRLVNSPRDHYFKRLVETPRNFPMERGNVLHEAAEIYVNDPTVAAERRDELLAAMGDRVEPFIGTTRHATSRTRLDVGLEVLTAYLDAHPPRTEPVDLYDAPDHENPLADELGVTLESELCERWFRNDNLGGHGIVDLLQDGRTLVDYKTGRPRSVSDVERQADFRELSSTPDFQVLLYLAHHRHERPDEELRMRFVHLLGAVHETVKGAVPPLEDLVTELRYVPWTFGEFVAQRDVFDQLTDYADTNDRCKVLNPLGYEWYREFFQTHELPRAGEDPERREAIREEFRAVAEREIGEYAYVENGVDTIFGDLEDTPPGFFTKGDIDAFEQFLADRLAELNEYRASRFPVSFREDGPNWDRVDHRDLILTGGVTDE